MTKKNPNARLYPKKRAVRVNRATMTTEEWAEHKRRQDCEKCARWNARNPGKSRNALRKRRHESPWYQAWTGAAYRARQRSLEFDLTTEWAAATYTGVCCLTGIPFIIAAKLTPGKSGLRPYAPSIDKIDPLKGYTQDNCRWILASVNSFKGTMSDAEMYHIAEALLAKRLPNS